MILAVETTSGLRWNKITLASGFGDLMAYLALRGTALSLKMFETAAKRFPLLNSLSHNALVLFSGQPRHSIRCKFQPLLVFDIHKAKPV
jgi:hypothetical protein